MGGKTSTSTQQVQVPANVLAQYSAVNARADQTANTPFQTYGGEFVAPVNSQQQTGIANTNAAEGEAQPYFDAATGTLVNAQNNTTGINNAATGLAAGSAAAVNPTALDSNAIGQYINPYLSTVLGSTSALLNQNNQQQQSGQLGTAIQSGAFGGDRTGIAAANLEQQQNISNANIYSGIASNAYDNALATAQQQQGVGLAAGQANRAALNTSAQTLAGIGQTEYGEGANTATGLANIGTGAQTAGLQGANAQIAAGTVEQQTQQAQDAALYNQFQQQQSYPFQVDQFLANIAEGTGALSGSTTTTQQPGGFFSDKRLKRDIKKIGETYDGQDIYSYKMHGDNRTHIGLIAQKVEKKHPDAVGLAGGYKIVDYGRATEDAANRGHFYSGGVVPMRRVARAAGGPSIVSQGELNAILQAQREMYAPHASSAGVYGGEGGSVPRGGSSRVPPPSGAVSQLVTAQGAPRPQTSAMQNMATISDIGKKAGDIWHSRAAKTPGDVEPSESSETTSPGLASGGRAGYDDGGGVDFNDLVNQHGAMYNHDGQQQRNIPNAGGSHQLAVASGSPTPAPSGSSNVNQAIGLGQKGYQAYKHFNPPSTGLGGGMTTPADMSGAATAATAPPVDAGTMSGLASTAPAAEGAGSGAAAGAGEAAAGSAAGAAGGAAAGAAGETAAAEAAAALAAEYAAAEVGAAAVIAAKRGGRIKRDLGGGLPYAGDDSLDIPDDANTEKLQTAGPMVKQPTGLQTLMKLGTQEGAEGAMSGMFSNQALARGGLAGGRRGYDDGGGVDPTDDPNYFPDAVGTGKIDRSGSGLLYTRDAGSKIPYASPPLKSKEDAVDPEVASFTNGNFGANADYRATPPGTGLAGGVTPNPGANQDMGGKDFGGVNPRTWDAPDGGLAASTAASSGPPSPNVPPQAPVKYDGGVDLQKPAEDLSAASPDKAKTPGWWTNVMGALKDSGLTKSENLIPILTGIAAMGTAPTRSLGVALASGLGAGTAAYLPTQQKQADIAQTKSTTGLTGVETQGGKIRNIAQLQAQYALKGLALFPAADGPVQAPDGSRYIAVPKTQAMGDAQPSAPAQYNYLGQNGTAAAKDAYRQYVTLPDEAQQASSKKIGDTYQSGSDAQEQMLHTQHWEQAMAANKGVLDNGAYSELRTKAANIWNTAMDVAGKQDAKIDVDGMTQSQIAQKMSIGAAAAGENANQQRSFGALKAFLAATPNTDMAKAAAIPLIADLHVQQQQSIDKKNYFHEFDQENQRNRGLPQNFNSNDAQQAFDKDYPANNYEGDRNKLSAIMQSTRYAPVMNVLQNGSTDEKKKMIKDLDTAFGPNFHRYFTGS